jgi:NADH:ubiquinone oxidoreductase subunit 5 (subunit L)/multisubunit Na+/H+ antiporter MnhA subunit
MPGTMTLLAIALLPLAAGLLVAAFGPRWQRWFGAERALMVAFRIALGGTLLAALLLGTAVSTLARRPELSSAQPVAWARVGHTTMLGLDVELDALALAVAGLALVVALAVQIAALGARALGRSGLALGGVLLLALSATAWGAALGWQILALVAGACGGERGAARGAGPREHVGSDMAHGAGSWGHVGSDMANGAGLEGHVPEPRPRPWSRASDAGVWLALLMMALGVGELGLGALERATLLAGRSRLVVAELGGVSLATVAALGLALAVLGRIHGLPAALRGEGPVTRAVVHGLVAGAGVLLLLRLHLLLALAPGVMAALCVVGAGLALAAGVAGLRARGVAATLGRVTQAQLGLMLTAIGLGAWVPACGLLLAHGLASGALALAPEGHAGRASRWLAGLALAGLLPLGAGLWSGELLGASAVYLSAWSPGLNVVVTGLVALAVLLVAAGLARIAVDRPPTGGGSGRSSVRAG